MVGETPIAASAEAVAATAAPAMVMDASGKPMERPAPASQAGVVQPALSQTPAEKAYAEAEQTRQAQLATLSAAEQAVKDAATPEAKKLAEGALAKIKAPADPVAKAAAEAAALAAAEKAVADAKEPAAKAAAEKALADLKAAQDHPGVAPEAYKPFASPQGITFDLAQIKTFESLARGLNLSQGQAQKLIDFEVARVQAAAATQKTAWADLLGRRLSEAKADPVIGGAKFDASVADAKVFVKQFGSPGLQKFLDTTEAGSHVEVIRAFAKAGAAFKDDAVHLGGTVLKPGETPSLADRLFPVPATVKN